MKGTAFAVLLALAPVLFAQTPYLVKEIHPGENISFQGTGLLLGADDLLYFVVAKDGTMRLWVSDGTSAGTIELAPLPRYPDIRHAAGRSLYFMIGDELWTSAGTPQGTGAATELIARFPQRPFLLELLGDTLLVSCNNVLYATKLASGSPAVRIGVSSAARAIELAGRIYIFAGRELWETDGSEAGTRRITDALPQLATSVEVLRGEIYFGGNEIWKTDGTIDGSVRVATARGTGYFTAGNRMYFVSPDNRLWVTDGTGAGTRALPATIGQLYFAAAGNRLVFGNVDAERAVEPWVSDGSVEGTKRLADLVPGSDESWVGGFVSAGDEVYFPGLDPEHGRELWVTNGTPEGTRLVSDLYPGTRGSEPEIMRAGDHLFFIARAPAIGRELHAIALNLPIRVLIDDVRVAEQNTTVRFTVRLSTAPPQTTIINYTTSDGDATAGSDYATTTGTLTFAPGETTKTIDVPIFADTLFETNERFFLTAGTTTAFAMIEDSAAPADLALRLDFTTLAAGEVKVIAHNNGPSSATNVQRFITQTPSDANSNTCATCEPLLIASGQDATVATRTSIGQAWFSATVDADQSDPQTANNTIAWTQSGPLAIDAPFLTPGAQATLHVAPLTPQTITLQSSNPLVVSVPATTTSSAVTRAEGIGRATIRAFRTGNNPIGEITIDVVAPGTTPRWSGAIGLEARGGSRIDQPYHVEVRANGIAPLTQHTATGIVTITRNGEEVARGMLTANAPIFGTMLYATAVGLNQYTVQYEGDAHFLPQSLPFLLQASLGRATMTASVAREGTTAIVRVRVTGSPVAPPTGSVRIRPAGGIATITTPLVDGEAIFVLSNLPSTTRTATLDYFGDDRYDHVSDEVSLLERRRAVRH